MKYISITKCSYVWCSVLLTEMLYSPLFSILGATGVLILYLEYSTKQVAVMLLCVCALDALYMLSLYKAFTLISPVYVAAIKRGGGVLLGSLIGALGFGEPMRGRGIPILAMTTSVVLLCIK